MTSFGCHCRCAAVFALPGLWYHLPYRSFADPEEHPDLALKPYE